MANQYTLHVEVDACRRAEVGLSRVLSLNQSLVEAFTGVRRDPRPESAPVHPLLSPRPAPVPRPARLGQAAYTSPLPHVQIDSPRRAGALAVPAATWQNPFPTRRRANKFRMQLLPWRVLWPQQGLHLRACRIHDFASCKVAKDRHGGDEHGTLG